MRPFLLSSLLGAIFSSVAVAQQSAPNVRFELDRAQPAFVLDSDAYVAIVRVDADGQPNLLFPAAPGVQTLLRARKAYPIPGNGATTAARPIQLAIIASTAPLNFDWFAYHEVYGWNLRYPNGRIRGDIGQAMEQLAAILMWGAPPGSRYSIAISEYPFSGMMEGFVQGSEPLHAGYSLYPRVPIVHPVMPRVCVPAEPSPVTDPYGYADRRQQRIRESHLPSSMRSQPRGEYGFQCMPPGGRFPWPGTYPNDIHPLTANGSLESVPFTEGLGFDERELELLQEMLEVDRIPPSPRSSGLSRPERRRSQTIRAGRAEERRRS